MPEHYNKQALSFVEQLAKLQEQGLIINEQSQALKTLKSINYYRLSGYWYPFRARDAHSKVTSQFEANTNFSQVIALYEFDRKLRSLILDAIERIEVAIRTQITYYMGQTYGAFAHTDPANFHTKFEHRQWLEKLEVETNRSSDEFLKHYKTKYAGFPRVPIWMVTEVMSFGALSLFYSGLRNDQKSGIEDKKAISQHFGVHHKRLKDWLHTLTYIRNVCAHHSRLWNRELAIRPDQVKDAEWLPPLTPRNDRIFYVLLILRQLMRAIGGADNAWTQDVSVLLEPIVATPRWRVAMGMPENWQAHPVWNNQPNL